MKNIIVAWVNNPALFETIVPLQLSGRRNQQLGLKEKLNVVFLEGYELIDEKHKSSLQELGYELHNGEKIYQQLNNKYNNLNQFGDYEKKCFLRWLVISEYFKGENIIHYDGDIIFNEDPYILQEKLKGMTFVLQGCPALTVINDNNWYSQYKYNLDSFANNIVDYSAKAWKSNLGKEEAKKIGSGIRTREIISSDQDLLRHLIQTKSIHQARIEDITFKLNDYVVFENPLYLDSYYRNSLPINYQRRTGIDYLNEKKVLFWHMQSDCISYLTKFIILKEYLTSIPVAHRLNLKSNKFERSLLKIFKKVKKIDRLSRLEVCKFFFEDGDFSKVFNDKVWWKKGVFQKNVL